MTVWFKHKSLNAQAAQFHRADLHIHSFGNLGSSDVTDTAMTPENIVDTAISEKLHVIAITDHNQIGNVRRGIKQAEGKTLLVVPGVELSTPQGHLLVYCPTPADLETFYGKLKISPDKKTCHDTIPQCLKYAEEFDGFGICAIISTGTRVLSYCIRNTMFLSRDSELQNLVGLEVTKADNSPWFSHSDDDTNRKNCARLRCTHLGHEDEIELAKVMASDAHSIGALGEKHNGSATTDAVQDGVADIRRPADRAFGLRRPCST